MVNHILADDIQFFKYFYSIQVSSSALPCKIHSPKSSSVTKIEYKQQERKETYAYLLIGLMMSKSAIEIFFPCFGGGRREAAWLVLLVERLGEEGSLWKRFFIMIGSNPHILPLLLSGTVAILLKTTKQS